MKNTTNAKTTNIPHVKWGHLLGAIVIALIALALIALNLTKTILGVVAVDIFIAYGPFVAFLLLVVASLLLVEDFLPSLAKRKVWKKNKAYAVAVRTATMDSIKSNLRYERAQMDEFLETHPKYRYM